MRHTSIRHAMISTAPIFSGLGTLLIAETAGAAIITSHSGSCHLNLDAPETAGHRQQILEELKEMSFFFFSISRPSSRIFDIG